MLIGTLGAQQGSGRQAPHSSQLSSSQCTWKSRQSLTIGLGCMPSPSSSVCVSCLLCRTVLCRAVLCRAVPCRAMPCCAVPCCAVPCCAVLCCAVLCCAVLCCAMRTLHNDCTFGSDNYHSLNHLLMCRTKAQYTSGVWFMCLNLRAWLQSEEHAKTLHLHPCCDKLNPTHSMPC